MTECTRIEALLTPWVDGELDGDERMSVELHLTGCEACRARSTAERGARMLLRERRQHLTGATAPDHLRARLAALAADASARPVLRTGHPQLRAAIAATLVLALSGLALHVVTGRSTTVLAAQLAADHVKCHLFEHDRGTVDARDVRDRLVAHYGFDAQVPASAADLQLRLIGVRRCLTGEGTNAHILYRAAGRPVSLYFVPHHASASALVEVLGQRAHVWSRHNGTYVLVADPAAEGLPEVLAYMQASTR